MTSSCSRSPSPDGALVRQNLQAFLKYAVNPVERGDYLRPFLVCLGVKDRWRIIFLCFYLYGLLPKGPICDGLLCLEGCDAVEFELNLPLCYTSYSCREQEEINEVIEAVKRYDHKYDSWGGTHCWAEFPKITDPASEGGFPGLINHAIIISVNM